MKPEAQRRFLDLALTLRRVSGDVVRIFMKARLAGARSAPRLAHQFDEAGLLERVDAKALRSERQWRRWREIYRR